jgi:hypothetical protein
MLFSLSSPTPSSYPCADGVVTGVLIIEVGDPYAPTGIQTLFPGCWPVVAICPEEDEESEKQIMPPDCVLSCWPVDELMGRHICFVEAGSGVSEPCGVNAAEKQSVCAPDVDVVGVDAVGVIAPVVGVVVMLCG